MGLYVCGFNVIKSEYHEVNKVVILFVTSRRNKQEKVKSSTSSCLLLV